MDPFASALEQAAAVRRRDVSASELVDMYRERIARDGVRTNAFWLTTPELARSQAEELPDGPLAGGCTSVADQLEKDRPWAARRPPGPPGSLG